MNILYKKTVLLFSVAMCLSTQGNTEIQHVTSHNVSSDYAKTRYPIVFNHGMLGFTRLGFKNFGFDYFYQILPDLARQGATVYATQVSQLESTETRGEQLLAQVDEILAITGASKVNLIGHSHGGPTIRYIEIVAPQKVASLTAIGAPFKGSKIFDDVNKNILSFAAMKIIAQYLIAPLEMTLEGNLSLPQSFENTSASLSEKGTAKFNQKYPSKAIPQDCGEGQYVTQNGIYHYSWTGVAQATNLLDIVDSTITVLAPLSYKSLDNDGLVMRCSAHYGKVIRDNYRHNHLDQINLMFGLRGSFTQDPVSLYRQHSNRLKLAGL